MTEAKDPIASRASCDGMPFIELPHLSAGDRVGHDARRFEVVWERHRHRHAERPLCPVETRAAFNARITPDAGPDPVAQRMAAIKDTAAASGRVRRSCDTRDFRVEFTVFEYGQTRP